MTPGDKEAVNAWTSLKDKVDHMAQNTVEVSALVEGEQSPVPGGFEPREVGPYVQPSLAVYDGSKPLHEVMDFLPKKIDDYLKEKCGTNVKLLAATRRKVWFNLNKYTMHEYNAFFVCPPHLCKSGTNVLSTATPYKPFFWVFDPDDELANKLLSEITAIDTSEREAVRESAMKEWKKSYEPNLLKSISAWIRRKW